MVNPKNCECGPIRESFLHVTESLLEISIYSLPLAHPAFEGVGRKSLNTFNGHTPSIQHTDDIEARDGVNPFWGL